MLAADGNEARDLVLAREAPRHSECRRPGMDDKTKKAAQDRQRINLSEDYELRYWTETLGITAEKLRETVNRVGPMASDVRQALGK